MAPVTYLYILSLMLVAAKMFGNLSISWWWAFAPALIYPAVLLASFVAGLLCVISDGRAQARQARDERESFAAPLGRDRWQN